MSEFMALRAQILDNIQILYPDFKTDSRFVLVCSLGDGSEKWTVILGRPILDRDGQYANVYGKGIGGTPEAAYKDLLKSIALQLNYLGF